MSGHSKWSTIKHKKAAVDAKRGKIFSKIAKEILIAAKQGGGDPAGNITLRALIQKARGVNMPADNIDRAIKKGTGELAAESLEEILYEGYAPGGVGLVIEVLTDNRNRSISEIKNVFTRYNSSLSGTGSVARSFARKGTIEVPAEGVNEDKLIEVALEAGAEDAVRDGDSFTVTTDPSSYPAVLDAFNSAKIPITRSEVGLVPSTSVPVTSKAAAESLLKFVEALEDLDDVQNVYANFDLDESLMSQLESA